MEASHKILEKDFIGLWQAQHCLSIDLESSNLNFLPLSLFTTELPRLETDLFSYLLASVIENFRISSREWLETLE